MAWASCPSSTRMRRPCYNRSLSSLLPTPHSLLPSPVILSEAKNLTGGTPVLRFCGLGILPIQHTDETPVLQPLTILTTPHSPFPTPLLTGVHGLSSTSNALAYFSGRSPLSLSLTKPSPSPALPLPQGELTARHFLRENRKGAHTGVRPYSTVLPVGADPRVCPAQQKPTQAQVRKTVVQ